MSHSDGGASCTPIVSRTIGPIYCPAAIYMYIYNSRSTFCPSAPLSIGAGRIYSRNLCGCVRISCVASFFFGNRLGGTTSVQDNNLVWTIEDEDGAEYFLLIYIDRALMQARVFKAVQQETIKTSFSSVSGCRLAKKNDSSLRSRERSFPVKPVFPSTARLRKTPQLPTRNWLYLYILYCMFVLI